MMTKHEAWTQFAVAALPAVRTRNGKRLSEVVTAADVAEIAASAAFAADAMTAEWARRQPDPGGGTALWTCPSCGVTGGGHTTNCSRRPKGKTP